MKGKRVIVLHSGAPGPNDGLVELELLLQILKENELSPELFFTYFPYSRQDKIFETGETNVAENLIKKLMNYYLVKKIFVIDAHFGEREWVKKYPLINISAIPLLMERAKKDFGENILFLATDKGGRERFKIPGFDKLRRSSFEIELKISKELVNSMKGKIVGIVDDILGTGGTLLKARKLARKSGAKRIIALVSHPLLKEGILKIKKEFGKVYFTNTIFQPKIPQIDITELILKAISKDAKN